MGNLMVYDGKNFLDKYMRFMSKDVYISSDVNEQFLSSYQYLLDEVKKEQYLYQDQVDIRRIVSIFEKNKKLLKMHNQKYLKKAIDRYHDFFNKLYSDDVLDRNKKIMILMEEKEMYSVVNKNYIPFIVGKVAYLKNICRVSANKILVLVDNYDDDKLLKKELMDKNVDGIRCSTLASYRLSTLKEGENYLDYSSLYQLLFSYIIYELFPDKKRFYQFFHAFDSYIYLNKDYKKFEQFRDYHNYLYRMKLEMSGLSLKKFNEKEIMLRRGHLRTIRGEFLSCKEMVDVANFLEINSISYDYDGDDDAIVISSYQKQIKISFDKLMSSDVIGLDKSSKKYLEVLVYELIKRRVPLELKEESVIFEALRDSTIDSYFCEVIKNILIPYLMKVENHFDMSQTCFSKVQLRELEAIREYYLKVLKKKLYIDSTCLDRRVADFIQKSSYEYIILLGDILDLPKKCIRVVKGYSDVYMFKNQIKLMYDYKKYLKEHKQLLGVDTYVHQEELLQLTSLFLKNHLYELNEQVRDTNRKIYVCFYDDGDRIYFSRYLVDMVYSIIKKQKHNNIILGVQNNNDISLLVKDSRFVKVSKSTLKCDIGEVECNSISSIDKDYSVVIVPYLIKDMYHKDMFRKDDINQVKILIYMALSHCKDSFYLLCPLSRKEEYRGVFDKFGKFIVM